MELTLSALNTTIALILRELRLGSRSFSRTDAYTDFVSVTFCAPNLTKDDAASVDRHFQILAERYGWLPPKSVINAKANSLTIALQKTTGEGQKRMPI